jgi:hypothetical protein
MPNDQLRGDVDRAVARHFDELSRSAARHEALGECTVREIAAAARAHLYQGCAFLEAGMHDAAIHHLAQAAMVMPEDLFTHVALSRAHLERYERHFKRADGDAAERLAAICQAIDPFHGHAVEVLARTQAVRRDRESLLRARLTLGTVIVGLLVGVTALCEALARG